MNNKNLSNKIATIAGLFLGAFVLSALAADWTAPTANPPANNTKAPINVGTILQSKDGTLTVKNMSVGKTTVPASGYSFDVVGNGLLSGLLVSGKTVTDTLQIGSTDISKTGYVLTNKDGTGEAEWKPNTSGLSGASRIYCAAASDGKKYYIPKDKDDAFSTLIDLINTEISSELNPSSNQLLNLDSLSTNEKVGLLKTSFKTKSRTEDYFSIADRKITNTNAPRAYCPTGKNLLFHSMIGWAKDEQNNALEQIVGVINGNYTENYISCVAKGQDRPTLVVGMGLCI